MNTVFMPDALQTTTWRFDADGACMQTFLTIVDGFQSTEDRPCTWIANATTVTVSYAGASGPVTFALSYSFPSADVLELGSDQFGRVS